MREGWRRVQLGDVAQLDIERVPVVAGRVYPTAGVMNEGKGLFAREPLTSADTSYAHLHRLRAGQLVMRKLTAFEGSLGIVPTALDGSFVSTEFPTFTVNQGDLLPEYLALVCQQPPFWHEMWLRSTGTVQRRKRVNPGALLSIEVDLPPLSEQWRVVDLAASVRESAAACRSVIDSSERALQSLRREAFDSGPEVELGELLDRIEAGKSPVALDRPPDVDERGVLKVSAVRASGFDPRESKAVAATVGLPVASQLAPGDLLMTRANTAQLVGMACVVEEAPTNLFLCDKTLRLVPVADQDTRALCELLLSPQVREQLVLAGTGTSGSMKNISQAKLRALRVPRLSAGAQAELRDITGGLRGLALAQRSELAALEVLEDRLLADLLSGSNAIPQGYDALLGEAA